MSEGKKRWGRRIITVTLDRDDEIKAHDLAKVFLSFSTETKIEYVNYDFNYSQFNFTAKDPTWEPECPGSIHRVESFNFNGDSQ